MLFTEAVEKFRLHQINIERSPKTIKGYNEDLTLFNAHLEEKYNCPLYVEDITKEDIEAYLFYLKEKKQYQPASRKRILGSIRSFFNYSYTNEWCKRNVAAVVEPIKCQQKERHYLSEEEVFAFIEAIEHQLVKLVAQTLYYTGVRISECLHLKTEDVDMEKELIHIRNGKGNKDRTIPMNPKLKTFFSDYLANWKIPSDYFFATKISGRLSKENAGLILRQTSRKLGLKKNVTAHILRHSFASNLVKKDVHLVKISKLLGHSSLKTTSIYVHSNISELQDAVNTL